MKRPHAMWALAVALLLGCQGQRVAYDPFGRTTIPAPATGAVGAPGTYPTYAPAALPPGAYVPPANQPLVPAPAATPGPITAPPMMPAIQAPTSAPGTIPASVPATPVPPPTPAAAPLGSRPGAPAATPAAAPGVPRVIQPSPPWSGGAAANWTSPSGTALAAGSSAAPPAAAAKTPAALPLPAAAPVGTVPSSQVVVIDNTPKGEPVVRIQEAPATVAAAAPAPIGATAALPASTAASFAATSPAPPPHTTDLASLPAGDHSILVATSPASGSSTGSGVAQVSHVEQSPSPTFRAATISSDAATPSTATHYGHNAEYTSLKGRLEYSAAKQQWKLRYIPADAPDPQVDQFGGSVVLETAPDATQFHDGDFVTVRGTIGKRDPKAKDYSASYEVSQMLHAN